MQNKIYRKDEIVKLRKIKRYLVDYNTPIYLNDGLFFTAKIGE